jgi:hypothetical protein
MHDSPIHLPDAAQSNLATETGGWREARLRKHCAFTVFLLLHCSQFYCSRAARAVRRGTEKR